ncbi:MAG: 2-amino-4-hydroxy-6-hydroxymethyldihydropteridine diphosphokinase [Gammaproteobacteria bacterium]
MALAYIGLGSNLDGPQTHISRAITELADIPESRVVDKSSLYISPPMGPQDQPDFINAVVKLETLLSADELLEQLQKIEEYHGRRRDQHWGPRTLDLDLLLYDKTKINNKNLIVPHPHIASRNFVLCPLLELDPLLDIPELGPARDLLSRLDVTKLQMVEAL